MVAIQVHCVMAFNMITVYLLSIGSGSEESEGAFRALECGLNQLLGSVEYSGYKLHNVFIS